jgi:hypothetical protein
LIIAATFLVYWPALRNGFVWDDTALVLRDPLIRSWRLLPESFEHFLFLDATASDFYRPLQRLTFTADYALYGFGAPLGWHLTSIFIHAAAAVLLWVFIRKLIGPHGGEMIPLACALVWAIHPLQTSAVTYIAGRADPLAALFGFGALTLGLIALERSRRTFAANAGAAACFLAALLSKESGIAALLVWFLILGWRRVGWRIAGFWIAAAVLVIGFYLMLRMNAERVPPPARPPTPLAIRPIIAARAVAEYAGLIVAPLNLRMERDVRTAPQKTPEQTIENARRREYQTLAGVTLILAFGWWWRRSRRRNSTAALCLTAALLTYLPVSNLFSLNATIAEHWLYFPSCFLFLAFGLSLRRNAELEAMPNSAGLRVIIFRSVLVAWVCFLGARTWLRQGDWKDQRIFLERTIAAGGDSVRMRINLGALESSLGRHDLALAHFRRATTEAPEQMFGWLGLANAALRAGDLAAARAALERVETAPFLRAEVLVARAALTHREGGANAEDFLRQAVEAAPDNWAIRRRYVEHLDELEQTNAAADHLRDFIGRQPFRAESWRLLGSFLEKLSNPKAAEVAYEHAAARDVRDETSRTRLAFLQSAED